MGRKDEAGLSLLEALSALAVLVFASVAALGIYERMWSSYKNGENAAEQQQGRQQQVRRKLRFFSFLPLPELPPHWGDQFLSRPDRQSCE